MNYKTVKPFIKWAGGKSQLLNEIRAKYPETIDKYCEPFVGGGAVLLDVLANCHPKEVLINDINAELIGTYKQIRDNIDDVVAFLAELQDRFWEKDDVARKEMYMAKRERFNQLISVNSTDVETAVLFIFLNKACFNGLYRVNGKGAAVCRLVGVNVSYPYGIF